MGLTESLYSQIAVLEWKLKNKEEELHAMRQNLKSIEWSNEWCDGYYCPSCESDKDNGHKPDCWLAKALQEVQA